MAAVQDGEGFPSHRGAGLEGQDFLFGRLIQNQVGEEELL
jgi:hypothetical protein